MRERRKITGKIRHLAIRAEDTGKLASFNKEVFELKELHRLYHFEFEVDDADQVIERLKKLNISKLPKTRDKAPFAETRASDPDGNYFDISGHGFLDLKPPEEKEGT